MNEDDVTEPGVEQNERATAHREAALEIVADGGESTVALVHAALAIEARIDELIVYLAQAR